MRYQQELLINPHSINYVGTFVAHIDIENKGRGLKIKGSPSIPKFLVQCVVIKLPITKYELERSQIMIQEIMIL